MIAFLVAVLLAQTSAGPAPATDAAESARRAAEAAEKAAEAAQRAAEAAQKAAESVAAKPAAPAPAAAPAAAAPPAPVTWSGTVALGLIALTGNSQTLTFATNAGFERKSPDWIWGIKAAAAYGQTTAAAGGESQVTALMGMIQARGDRRFSELISLYLLAGIDTDHLKAIEERPYGELGISLLWWDEKVGDLQKSTFKTDLGFRYGREFRFQYYPTQIGPSDPAFAAVDIVAPRVGAAYRYAVSKDIIFTEDLSLLANLVGEARLLFGSTSKLSTRLTEKVSLGVSFVVTDDTVPAKGKVPTDTALTVGLEVGL